MTADRIPALLEPIQNRLSRAEDSAVTCQGDGLDKDYINALEVVSVDSARLLAAVQAMSAIHKPVTYWMTHEDADVSYQNKQDALWCRGDLTEADLVPFELCTHCKMIEDSPCDGECTSAAGYREAPWPCPTVKALAAALDG